jgi:elongation factor P
MYDSSDLRKGLKIQIDGEPYIITQFDFSKPGKGQSIYKVRMKNMLTGSSIDRSYRSNETFHRADLNSRHMEYSYFDGQNYVFVDTETYENFLADESVAEGKKGYMLENTVMEVLFFGEKIIDVTLPPFVELKITRSEPGVKGDTATNVTKPATLETGIDVNVPLFVDEGEIIKVDTRTGEYVERAKD